MCSEVNVMYAFNIYLTSSQRKTWSYMSVIYVNDHIWDHTTWILGEKKKWKQVYDPVYDHAYWRYIIMLLKLILILLVILHRENWYDYSGSYMTHIFVICAIIRAAIYARSYTCNHILWLSIYDYVFVFNNILLAIYERVYMSERRYIDTIPYCGNIRTAIDWW